MLGTIVHFYESPGAEPKAAIVVREREVPIGKRPRRAGDDRREIVPGVDLAICDPLPTRYQSSVLPEAAAARVGCECFYRFANDELQQFVSEHLGSAPGARELPLPPEHPETD